MKGAFDKTAKQTGTILKNIGYGLNSIVTGIFNAFNVARQNFIDLLRDLGFALQDILAAIASLVF